MKRLSAVFALLLLLSGFYADSGRAAVAGGGIPVTTNVSSSTGGSSILLLNANRVALVCQNIGTTNNIFVTFGQTPTTTNGFLVPPNGGYLSLPEAGCLSRTQGGGIGGGCVPTGAINAIAAGSGTNTLVCWED